VRPGRGRPGPARAGLALWLLVTLFLLRFGPPGLAILLAALGIYLVGPLWVPVRFRVDARGVERTTPFGTRLWAWDVLARFVLVPKERTGYLYPRGRGSARFLPPVLVMWEAESDLGPPLADWLGSRLEGKVAS
jgi:hypothetical protein